MNLLFEIYITDMFRQNNNVSFIHKAMKLDEKFEQNSL